MKVTFLEIAETELDDAIEYYESEQLGLGDRFRQEVLRSVIRIQDFPLAYQSVSERTCRCLIAKFPYAIIYQFKPNIDSVLVVAIAHLHRKPKYWVTRGT